jgi:hypothetical protein
MPDWVWIVLAAWPPAIAILAGAWMRVSRERARRIARRDTTKD